MTLQSTLFTQTMTKFRLIGFISFCALGYAFFVGGSWQEWVLSAGVYFLYACVGVAVTFHRYLTHSSFEMPKWKEYVMAFLGHLAGTSSAIAWVATHIDHHRFSDTEKDPHALKNGVLKLLLLDYKESEMPRSRAVIRLINDPFYMILHKYFLLLHIVWVGILYGLFGFDAVLFGHLVPVSLVFAASGAVNVFGHKWGEARHATNDDSKNNLFVALFTWGEGWHNTHHRFPTRANFAERWWELDVSWMVIRLVQK